MSTGNSITKWNYILMPFSSTEVSMLKLINEYVVYISLSHLQQHGELWIKDHAKNFSLGWHNITLQISPMYNSWISLLDEVPHLLRWLGRALWGFTLWQSESDNLWKSSHCQFHTFSSVIVSHFILSPSSYKSDFAGRSSKIMTTLWLISSRVWNYDQSR